MHECPYCASSGEVLVPVVAFCHHFSSLALSTTLQPTYQLFPSGGESLHKVLMPLGTWPKNLFLF